MEIGRIGPMLLADRYDDRTHFIFELLQNAEDALARRENWTGLRSVTFELSRSSLRVSHFGAPFTEKDVRGICGIAESTKEPTAIGRFGIGFKSVYAFTDRPEIHSGDEHFTVENFVWPTAVEPCETQAGETVFILPFRRDDADAVGEIAAGLQRLGPRVLLFLREIDEISWSVKDGASGVYLRGKPEPIAENGRKIVVIGETEENGVKTEVEESWLVFSREVCTDDGRKAGYVEVAFALVKKNGNEAASVRPVDDSELVIFFPTVVTTHLGFLVQGPYRTTPSRDNIQRHDPWNRRLVQATAVLLVETLRTMRNLGLLDTGVLRTLPIDPVKFGKGEIFAPLFEAVRDALSAEPLLPKLGGGYVSALDAKLGRTQEIRQLLNPSQLGELLGENRPMFWLDEAITQDRTPELRRYLMQQLGVAELTLETVLPKLNERFLETQSDKWILQLYEYLHIQPALVRQGRLNDIPLIRLEDGRHVTPMANGRPQAFLPGRIPSGFPTVRREVCSTDGARSFLEALDIKEPDPVDDVTLNILPKYRSEKAVVGGDEYEADIRRIQAASQTDSKSQREKLLAALCDSRFVMAVDAGSGSKLIAKPGEVYIPTQRLTELFKGVTGVLFVDDSYPCLKGEVVRELLEACGATRYLQPVRVQHRFTEPDLIEMRRRAGCVDSSGGGRIDDFSLRGLDQLMAMLPTLDAERAAEKAELLWRALCDLEDRRGARVFHGTYTWLYYRQHSCDFDAYFIRFLNETAWVPDRKGILHPPDYVLFEETGWEDNPLLTSKIHFKPPAIEVLARKAGFEPGVLDLLKRSGITSEAELKARLGLHDEGTQPSPPPFEAEPPTGESTEESADNPLTRALPPVDVSPGPAPAAWPAGGAGFRYETDGGRVSPVNTGFPVGDAVSELGTEGETRTAPADRKHGGSPSTDRARRFISYLGVHPDGEDPDPDDLTHEERLALEEKAIALILAQEPELQRTPTNNPGFDLVALDATGSHAKWVEVKAMTGTMEDRPVGLTKKQFEVAWERRTSYWLYVVEHAGSPQGARIIRIQDPAGKARIFTFDHGWISIADDTDRILLDEAKESTG